MYIDSHELVFVEESNFKMIEHECKSNVDLNISFQFFPILSNSFQFFPTTLLPSK